MSGCVGGYEVMRSWDRWDGNVTVAAVTGKEIKSL